MEHFDLATTLALLGRASDAERAARTAIELVPVGQLGSHTTSAISPIKDSLELDTLTDKQREALSQVLDLFETAEGP